MSPPPPARPPVELLVFERADCTYCRVFRRDVLPQYRQAVREDAVPLRFVDIDKSDLGSLALKRRIDTLPTAVLMKNGSEVDRIVGYWGPDNFFKLLAHILARMESELRAFPNVNLQLLSRLLLAAAIRRATSTRTCAMIRVRSSVGPSAL